MKRLPTIGEVIRWFSEPGERPWPVPGSDDPSSSQVDPVLLAMVEEGLAYGDETIQRLAILQRWQLRSELERILLTSVTADWNQEEVHRLVDLVLEAWWEASPLG
ncbi:MAG TPA: hypothetical protein VH879_02015 [Gemmatimonadales bacterium]|jgi:hypothetical protein